MTSRHPSPPLPQGDYVPAKRNGELIFTSGMTPRENGVLRFVGPVRLGTPLEDYRAAAILAAGNALTAARQLLDEDEVIGDVLNLTVFIAAEAGFTAHARLADYASAHLREELGDAAIGCRVAVGVATLPGNAPVEIQLAVIVRRRDSR